MAGISEILQRKWPGQGWTLRGDDYSTLTWEATNTLPKPSESAIRVFSDEVDVIIIDENNKVYQDAKFREFDGTLKAMEIITLAIADLQRQAGTGNLLPAAVNGINNLKTALINLRKLTHPA